MSMQIHFRAQDEKEEKEDPESKSFNKSAEILWDYTLDWINIITPEKNIRKILY